jgi:uncharacterized membrane protein
MSDNKCCGSSNVCGGGSIWLIGWIFSIGFLELGFWKATLAIIAWPYFLGVAMAARMAVS